MKIILLILSFVIGVNAQYGENLYTNPNITTNIVGWANWNSTPTLEFAATPKYEGNGALHVINTDGGGSQIQGTTQSITTVIGKKYRNRCYLYGDGTYEITCYAYSVGVSNEYGTIVSAAEWSRVVMTVTASVTTTVYGFIRNVHTSAADWYMDAADLRLAIDTLYTDPAQADETDNDSTKTLIEAFETRGSHIGGYFITSAGTYAESITIDSSFTKWEASGSATVTSVDFNSVTCIVDLLNLTIATKLNDSNVTYINSPSTQTGYGGYNKRPGYLCI